jgi:hypothetical protein
MVASKEAEPQIMSTDADQGRNVSAAWALNRRPTEYLLLNTNDINACLTSPFTVLLPTLATLTRLPRVAHCDAVLRSTSDPLFWNNLDGWISHTSYRVMQRKRLSRYRNRAERRTMSLALIYCAHPTHSLAFSLSKSRISQPSLRFYL